MTKTLNGVTVSRLRVDDTGAPIGGCVHSYLASLDGLMRGAGWWADDIAVLAGVSGIGFHFVVHPTWCASSTNAYDWVVEHKAAAGRLGVSSVAADHWDADGFADAQADAISAIKGAIDTGVAAIIWLPSPRHMGFGLVTGYDDDEGVFYVDDEQGDCDPVRYTNLGRTHDLPWLHYQVMTDRRPIDVAAAAKASLALAVTEWRRGSHLYQSTPFGDVQEYPAGYAGYGSLIDGLHGDLLGPGPADRRGLGFILNCWADGRRLVRDYLAWMSNSGIVDGLDEAVVNYDEVATALGALSNVLAVPVTSDAIAEAIDLLERTRNAEAQAVEVIERTTTTSADFANA